jgi:hypothetical protein
MSNGIAAVASTASDVVEQVHRVAPWIEGILPSIPTIGVPAATVVKILDSMEPQILGALAALAAANGGNLLQAQADLINHLTPGMPNAPALTPP